MSELVKSKCAELLGVTANSLTFFQKQDPFNPFILEGYITRSEACYGSMVITKIDNYLTEQLIYSTPKLKYPFDRNGIFKFPKARFIRVYEKYDGTNICSFCYKLKGEKYLSYKTRLNPVLGESNFGSFANLWSKILSKYPDLENFIVTYTVLNDINLSFELYGNMNEHLIRYDIDLDTVLLFGINQKTGIVIDPEFFKDKVIRFDNRELSKTPMARMETYIDNPHDLVSYYQRFKSEQELKNKELEDGTYEGSEGFVWYLHDINNNLHQFKCKPPSIEEIHFGAGGSRGLTKNSIMATVLNAYESNDDINFDIVKELLIEEFEERAINGHREIIQKCIDTVKEKVDFRRNVIKIYNDLHLDLKNNKVGTMRALSQHFRKSDMGSVFSVLENYVK